MRKTLFAGLTVLDPDESVTEDGGAFIGRDRDTLDRFLELGAKTHRHDGSVGLSNPSQQIGASAVASAGSIPADLALSISYTLEDDDHGETLIAPEVLISTPSPLDPPFVSPSGAADYTDGGDLPADTYYYAFSLVDGQGGETTIGPALTVERQPGFENARVLLVGFSDPVATASAAGWRLYRAVGGGDFNYLASGVGDSYSDEGTDPVDPDLQPLLPDQNTTNGDNSLVIALPSADAAVSDADFINVYLSDTGDFVGDVLLQQFPVGSAGKSVAFNAIELLEGSPPDTNTSIGGASQIDGDTELIDNLWKRPVDTFGDLPGSDDLGAVRMVLDQDPTAYEFTASGWVPLHASAAPTGGSLSEIIARIPSEVLLRDDFDADTISSGDWVVESATGGGNWTVSGGLLRYDDPSGSGSAFLRKADFAITDGIVTHHIQMPSGSWPDGVSWRFREGGGKYLTVQINDNQLRIGTPDSGFYATQSFTPPGAGVDRWVQITLEGADARIDIYDEDPLLNSGATPTDSLEGTMDPGDVVATASGDMRLLVSESSSGGGDIDIEYIQVDELPSVDSIADVEKMELRPSGVRVELTADSEDAAHAIVTILESTQSRVANEAGSAVIGLSDYGNALELASGASAIVPEDAVVDFPVGGEVDVVRFGTEPAAIVASGGVVLRSAGGANEIAEQYGVVTLRKRGPNDWIAWGDF